MLGLGVGFLLGTQHLPAAGIQPPGAESDRPDQKGPPPAKPEAATPSLADRVPPPIERSEEPPIKVISAPEAALKAFLSAPDWRARLKHSLFPEKVAVKMEAYYTETPYQPLAPASLKAGIVHSDKEAGTKVAAYQITTETRPEAFTVAVMETAEGWKVDWEAFTEFHDDHFARFAAGEGSETGTFHLQVRNTHYFGDKFPGIENYTAFLLDPPMSGRSKYGFVATGSDLHRSFAAAIGWGEPCSCVLEIARRSVGEGAGYLEITRIVSPNWRPSPD